MLVIIVMKSPAEKGGVSVFTPESPAGLGVTTAAPHHQPLPQLVKLGQTGTVTMAHWHTGTLGLCYWSPP